LIFPSPAMCGKHVYRLDWGFRRPLHCHRPDLYTPCVIVLRGTHPRRRDLHGLRAEKIYRLLARGFRVCPYPVQLAHGGNGEARWHLPILPSALPEHLTRVFGSLKVRHTAQVLALAYSPDGKRLAAISGDLRGYPVLDQTVPTEAKIWDAETGREMLTYRGHGLAPVKSEGKPSVGAIAFSPDGKMIASAGTD